MFSILIPVLCAGWAIAQSITPRGTFASPRTGVKWRYWIEDSSADLEVLHSDVTEMARVGSSGFQVLSYQSYGGFQSNTGNVILDPADFAFGSDRFVAVVATLTQAAKQHNMTIDLALGPNQGAGVPVKPADADQEGMLTELVFGSRFLQPGETFDGPLPSPVILPFIDVEGVIRSANTTQKYLVGVVGAQVAKGANIRAPRVPLDFTTVVDLTDEVQGSGDNATVSWRPPGNGTSVVLAFYYRRNGFPEARGGLNGAEDAKPGSWGAFVVDHFSAKGAEVSSRFIQDHILSREDIGEMLAEPGVGKYVWEDSMEFQTQVWWTDGFAKRFEERHGYSVGRVLPILHALLPGHALFSAGFNVNQTFNYGTTFDPWIFAEDYRDTLTSLYMDYMTAFNEWSHSTGLLFSNQPAYDFQIDPAASAAIPDVPEIESLSLPLVDHARQLSGGVHLGNRTIFSSETAARPGFAVGLPMPMLLEDSKAQFAGHVNQLVLHGYAYSGAYPNTTWPGICTFAYGYSDMHGPRMPAWDHYKGYLDYIARNQYILQSGTPKVDVAIYRKGYDFTRFSPSPFPSTSLTDAGYTYEYVSPENFKLPGVFVTNGRLALAGPAYKALVLSRIQNITIDAAQSLLDFANDGLPIIIAGGVPNGIPGFDTDGSKSDRVNALMEQLTASPTVKIVANEAAVSGALSSLEVIPAASLDPPASTLWTIRRDEESLSSNTSHFFLYNQAQTAIRGTLILNVGFEGTPFTLDGYSGTVTPIFIWNSTSSGTITIPGFSLAAGETALISVTTESELEGVASSTAHVVNVGAGVTAGTSRSGSFELHSSTEGSVQVTLSNGESQTIEFSLEGEVTRELNSWQLNITKWTPPDDLSQIPSKLIPEPAINLTRLVPWDQLRGHQDTSGVGTYITTFSWEHTMDGGVGLQLDFGSVVHTLKAWLNGVELPTADPVRPAVDISRFVKEGSNVLRVDAASTLLNVVNSVPEVMSLGQLRTDTVIIPPARQHYGLITPVRLIPYGRVVMNI
ncbi:hypothetical protein VNI00_012725 [Paramarasmius palmivorus]|uniref:Secreted protein n=1 Tax=Paramarasmius palmivorus TaxID=297713 RepID=A0AAW0C5C5_9AGAR